ncbi:hypothetical protein H8959_003683 [Pygathrix nigripes]
MNTRRVGIISQAALVAYLHSKNFSKADVAQMVTKAPFLLNFSVERLDNRLGFFQKELELSVKKTRDLVVRLPRLLTGSLEPVKENMKRYQSTKLLLLASMIVCVCLREFWRLDPKDFCEKSNRQHIALLCTCPNCQLSFYHRMYQTLFTVLPARE